MSATLFSQKNKQINKNSHLFYFSHAEIYRNISLVQTTPLNVLLRSSM